MQGSQWVVRTHVLVILISLIAYKPALEEPLSILQSWRFGHGLYIMRTQAREAMDCAMKKSPSIGAFSDVTSRG